METPLTILDWDTSIMQRPFPPNLKSAPVKEGSYRIQRISCIKCYEVHDAGCRHSTNNHNLKETGQGLTGMKIDDGVEWTAGAFYDLNFPPAIGAMLFER